MRTPEDMQRLVNALRREAKDFRAIRMGHLLSAHSAHTLAGLLELAADAVSSPSPIRREALEEAADLRDQLKQVLEGHVWEGRDWLVPLNDSDFPDCQAAVLDALVEFIRALASCDRSGAAAKTEGLGPEGESTVPRQGQTPPIRALIPGRTE